MSLKDTKPVVGIIVQARMGSTRLPGKVLKSFIQGETVLSYLLKRLSDSKSAEKLVVATTTNPKDDCLVNWLKRNHYFCFRGNEKDCLSRFYEASKIANLDIIVRITADCPLIVPEIIDQMIEEYVRTVYVHKYLSNRTETDFPEGLDVEIFNFQMLEEANKHALQKNEREHINYFFLNNSHKYDIQYFNHKTGDYSKHKLSIDTEVDLKNIKALFLDKGLSADFSFEELKTILDKK